MTLIKYLGLTLATTSLSGCWLVWGIEPLSNDGAGAQAGAGGTAGSGLGGAGGTGGTGGTGGGGGEPSCTKAEGTSGPFSLLAHCRGLAGHRLSADGSGVVLAGSLVGKDGSFVQTFSTDGTPIQHLELAGAEELSIELYGAGNGRKIMVGGAVAQTDTLALLDYRSAVCNGEHCGFLVSLDAGQLGLNGPPLFWDAGPTGTIVVEDVGVAQVKEYENDRFVAVTGTMKGSLNLLESLNPLSSPTEAIFLVTANIQTGMPQDAWQSVADNPSGRPQLSFGRKEDEQFRLYVSGNATLAGKDQATCSEVDPDTSVIQNSDVTDGGVASGIARTSSGIVCAHVRANQLWLRAFTEGVFADAGGPYDLVSARLAAAGDDVYVASSYSGTLEVGPQAVVSAGGRDAVLLRVDGATKLTTPLAISPGAAQDDELTDVTAVQSQSGSTIYLLVNFEGTYDFGGTLLEAEPGGSSFLAAIKL